MAIKPSFAGLWKYINYAFDAAEAVITIVHFFDDYDAYARAHNNGGVSYVSDIDFMSKADSSKLVAGYLIDNISENLVDDSYLSVNKLSVLAKNSSAYGIYHRYNGSSASFGHIRATNIDVISEADSQAAYGLFQENTTSFKNYVSLYGSVRANGADSDAYGIRGGTYEDSIYGQLEISAANGNSVGIYLEDSSMNGEYAKSIGLNVLSDASYSTLKSTSLSGGSAVGILSDGGRVSEGISCYNITASNEAYDSEASSLGIYLGGASSINFMSYLNVEASAKEGLAAALVVADESSVASISNVSLNATSENGRAVGIALKNFGENSIALDEIKISVSADGGVYGMAFGKDVSAETEESVGAVGVYNDASKDSSNVLITNSQISVKSTGMRIEESDFAAYGLYVGGEYTYSMGNDFYVESSRNVYGIFLTDFAKISSVNSVVAESSFGTVFGVYATANSEILNMPSSISANASGDGSSAYGVYLDGNAKLEDSNMFYVDVSASNGGVAYGIYKAGDSVSMGVLKAHISLSNTTNFSTYGLYISDDSLPENASLAVYNASSKNSLGMTLADGSTLASGSSITISANSTAQVCGAYISAIKSLGEDFIVAPSLYITNEGGEACGVLLSNSVAVSNIKGSKIEAYGMDSAYGIKIMSGASVNKITSSVMASVDTASGSVYGIYADGLSGDVDVSGYVKAVICADSSTSVESLGFARGIYFVNSTGKIDIGSVNVSVSGFEGDLDDSARKRIVAVETNTDANISMNISNIYAHGGEAVAFLNRYSDLKMSGASSNIYGDVIVKTDDGIKNDFYFIEGTINFSSNKIVADEFILGSLNKYGLYTTIAEAVFSGKDTVFEGENITFFASNADFWHSSIEVDGAVFYGKNKTVTLVLGKSFSCDVGDSITLFYGDENTIVLSALEEVVVLVDSFPVDPSLYEWGKLEDGYGITFLSSEIPEPKVYAVIFGIFAFAFVLFKRYSN